MRAAIYARVSTSDQSCQIQLQELRTYCTARGWSIEKEYVDHGVSGKSTKKRAAFKELMKDASQRKVDVVLVLKLDRFGRSVVDLVTSLQQLDSCGVRFVAITQGIDTDQANPTSRLLLNMLCAVAEFERELISERVKLGYTQYKEDYKAGRIGKEKSSRSGKNMAIGGQARIFDRAQVPQLRGEGKSIRQIAALVGISVGTVANVLASGCSTDRVNAGLTAH